MVLYDEGEKLRVNFAGKSRCLHGWPMEPSSSFNSAPSTENTQMIDAQSDANIFHPIKLNYLDLSEDPSLNYNEIWHEKINKVMGWFKPVLPEGIEIEEFSSPPLGYRSRCRFVIEKGKF